MVRQTINVNIATIIDTKSTDITEDTYLVHHNGEHITLMVADGAPQRLHTTHSLLPMLAQFGEGTATGRYAAYLTREVISEIVTSADMSLRSMALAANNRLRDELEGIYGEVTAEAVLHAEPSLEKLKDDPRFVRLILPVSCLTLARLNLYTSTLEYAHAGDTAVFLLYKDGRTVQITPDQMAQHDDRMRAEIQAIIDETGSREREALMAQYDRFQRVNVDNGIYHNYEAEDGSTNNSVGVGVINGLPQLEAYIVEGTVQIDDLEGVILSSDGFFWPSVLGETDLQMAERVNHMGQLLREHGLHGYMARLREEERADADGSRYLRFGSHDDATAIYLRFD